MDPRDLKKINRTTFVFSIQLCCLFNRLTRGASGMLRTTTFLGKSGILNPGSTISIISANWARKLRPIRDQSTLDCCDPVTIPICEEPKERSMMDLMPVPCGPWQEAYDEQNKKDTKVLLYSTGFFIFTLLCVNKVGLVKGYPDITFFG